jgi:hypothetical protein
MSTMPEVAVHNQSSSLRNIPKQLLSFIRRIRWFNFTFLVLIPVAGFVQALWVPLKWRTLIWSAIYYVLTAGSITTGKAADPKTHKTWANGDQGTIDYGLIGPTRALRR